MMKCLLLFLASGLVTADKLDRTYLPPPGAQYSGGTLDHLYPPLDYPKETYTTITQNDSKHDLMPDNMNTGIPTKQEAVTSNYLTSTPPNDFFQTDTFQNAYDTVSSKKPNLDFYNNFSPKTPSTGYLPTKNIPGQQFYMPKFNPYFESQIDNNFRPSFDRMSSGYYYVPATVFNKNFIVNPKDDYNRPQKVGYIQFPNQVNSNDLVVNSQFFKSKAPSANDIVQNYEPSAFGYYGGNPMIMSTSKYLPQNYKNKELNSKVEENDYSTPILSTNQRLLNDDQKSQNNFNPSGLRTSTTSPSTITQPKLPIKSTKLFDNKNLPPMQNQRNGIPVRTKFRQERPQSESERNAVIVNFENNISPKGYSYSYDTSNGIHADETATTTNGVRAQGSYSYTGDDGKVYKVTYTADENGYQPVGDHLPTPPPVPTAIKKIIEQAARNQAAGIVDDGSYDEKKYGHLNYQGAIGQYRPFKSSSKTSRLNSAKTRANRPPQRGHANRLHKSPFHSGNISSPINQISESQQQNQLSSGQNQKVPANATLLENRYDKIEKNPSNYRPSIPTYGINNNKNNINPSQTITENITNTFETNKQIPNSQNNELENPQFRKPIISVYDGQLINRGIPIFQTQNAYIENDAKNPSVDSSKKGTEDQLTKLPAGVTLTDDGYYYVPPIVKLNSNTKTPADSKKVYETTNKSTPKNTNTEANKRTDFDGPQENKNNANVINTTQLPFNKNPVITEPTRKPYISGPNDHDKTNYSSTESTDQKFVENDIDNFVTYPNEVDSSSYSYLQSTTPMNKQILQKSQPNADVSQYYQSTTNPTSIDQTLPSTVENRANLSSGKPGISVSQDFVTTTYKPTSFENGVLEVNQNVKIYGLGKPESSANTGYPDNISENNQVFYPTSISNEGSSYPGVYENNFYSRPIQNTDLEQGNPNQNTYYGNEYIPTGTQVADSGMLIEPYSNPGLEIESQGYPKQIPEIPFAINPEYTGPAIEEEQTSSTLPQNQNQGTNGGVVGEDFSGPKQQQKFDPKTGYYY